MFNSEYQKKEHELKGQVKIWLNAEGIANTEKNLCPIPHI